MASSDRARFLLVEETVPGVTPAAAGDIINVDTVTFTRNRNVRTPAVLRGDRRRYATTELAVDGALSIACEAQYGNFLKPLEGALGNDEAADYAISGTGISFDGTLNTIDDTGAGLGGIAVGDVVYVSGSASNDGWHGFATAVAAGSVTLDELVGSALVTEVAGASITISGKKLTDSTTLKTYSTEWELQDLASNFRSALYSTVTRYNRSWAIESFQTESVDFLSQAPSHANATVFTGAPNAALASNFMSSLAANVPSIRVGGLSTLEISRLEINIGTNARGRRQVGGATGFSGITNGSFDMTVTVDYYFDAVGRSLADLVDARTPSVVYVETYDTANRELWVLPNCTPDSGDANPGGENSDVTGTAVFTAADSTTHGYQMGVWRVG